MGKCSMRAAKFTTISLYSPGCHEYFRKYCLADRKVRLYTYLCLTPDLLYSEIQSPLVLCQFSGRLGASCLTEGHLWHALPLCLCQPGSCCVL